MGIVLDAGALVGYERSDRRAVRRIARARELGKPVIVPATVVAQVWRDGRRQARLATLFRRDVSEVVALDERAARAVGHLLGAAGTNDVVDASVVWCALTRDATILTSDPDDLRRLDRRVRLRSL